MPNIAIIQNLVQCANVDFWAICLIKSKQNTWQRSIAITGLRAAAHLAVGVEKSVTIEVAAPLRESAIIVDGQAFKLSFFRG